MKTEAQIGRQYRLLRNSLDERTRREWAGSEAMALGYEGISKVHRATGLAPSTIGKGIRELRAQEGQAPPARGERRVRKAGGGRKKKVDQDPALHGALEPLVEPASRGHKVKAEQMASINIKCDAFHGEWNYTIYPTGSSWRCNSETQSIG